MRLFLLAAILVGLASFAGTTVVVTKHHGPAGFCGGSFGFCDDFSSDTSANYTAYGNDTGWTISGGKLTGPSSGSVALSFIRNTATSTTSQYAIMRYDTVNDDQGVFLHAQPGSHIQDVIYITSGADGCTGTGTPASCCTGSGTGPTCKLIYWSEMNVLGTPTSTLGVDISNCVIDPPSAGDYLSVSLSGTTSDRHASAWITSSAPTGSPSGTPTCEWIGHYDSGVSANCCFRNGTQATGCNCIRSFCVGNEPSNGTGIGLWQYGSSPSRTYDDFAGGDQ